MVQSLKDGGRKEMKKIRVLWGVALCKKSKAVSSPIMQRIDWFRPNFSRREPTIPAVYTWTGQS